ncbi:hypothetical protein QFC24_000869 [Naganishia onofrii]|uniref:Uncharacterized protein n=1 Tax=Naganishia onofrii TaxID=1851511 RepID=A0ACC2XV05_9TREE|nr:hypothetical protein QFC24_000869 [Naganishia onofrii]
MSTNKLSFSLGKPKPGAPAPGNPLAAAPKPLALQKGKAPASKPTSANLFGGDDDDDESGPSNTPITAIKGGPSKLASSLKVGNGAIKQNASLSRAQRKLQEEALKLDQTVFEYDEVWDGMQNAREKVKEAKETEAGKRDPKYIDAFLKSAATRRLDRLRAEEKMMQHERDKEGDEFADKEKFMTTAYKKQLEETKKAEQEEKEREENERKSKKGPGMTAFYATLLNADEEKHAAAMAAASASANQPQGPSLAIRPPTQQQQPQYEPEAEEDPFLRREQARQAMEEAAKATTTAGPIIERMEAGVSTSNEHVEINDEGAVVDKRTLLKAGLNIIKKPIAPLPTAASRKIAADAPFKSRAVGEAASHRERMERERRRLAEQMEQENERAERTKRQQEEEEEEKARIRSTGGANASEVEAKRKAAKEKYEARKRAKLEQQSAVTDNPAQTGV